MAKIDNLVQDFLAQKKIAVVGVSDKRETGCNLSYKKFKDAGYQVYAVNPRITTYDGAPCYAGLEVHPRETRCGLHPHQPQSDRADRPAMCGLGHQTRLDALHDGHKTWFGGEHDQRLAIRGGDV